MSDIAIHQLPPAGTLTGSETVPIDDGTATVRTTVAALRAGLSASAHGHGIADVTGLQTALDAKASMASPAFTGMVALAAGAAAAPAMCPTGDADTGLFFPAANMVALATGGVERLRVADDGSFHIRPQTGGGHYLGLVPSAPHLAASVAAVGLTVVDGGGHSGVFVHNTHNGTHSSQDIRLKTAQGGATASVERARVAADGTITLGGGVGAEGLRVLPAAGANRAVTVTGSNGGDPTLATTGGRLAFGAVPVLPSYTVATLPIATARGLAYVSDGTANRRLAISDGTNWRWPDGALVS